ncbi:hypothetical protein IHE45_12G011000 [Dioscorea alata]|uniref:Uncharacterized protein n=1 Tax=Dioscorea alata TaxID=55571 RepID=A0ACB7V0B9_DIOAL|nr:hypothetical protein IHE45_12G011000 [Dioscorea alata]
MEKFNNGLKTYWKRRAYNRLEAPAGRRWWRRRVDRTEMGEERRRGIRIRIRVWRRLRKVTPRRILAWIRDGYARTMLGLDRSAMIGGYRAGFGTATAMPMRILTSIRDGYVRMMLGLERSATVGGNGGGFGTSTTEKEYDERVLVAIYRALESGEILAVGNGGD